MSNQDSFTEMIRRLARLNQQTREAQAETAMLIYKLIQGRLYREHGFRQLGSFVGWMRSEWGIQMSVRQVVRYRHAVETWIENLGFDKAILIKHGPSILGQITEMGAVNSVQEAKEWLRRLDLEGPTAVRALASGRPEKKENGAPEPAMPAAPPAIPSEESHQLEKLAQKLEEWAAGAPMTPRMLKIQAGRLRRLLETHAQEQPQREEA